MPVFTREKAARTTSATRGPLLAPRAQVVWGSLLASMTLVGGLLFAVDRAPNRPLQGVTLPALMAPGGSPSVDAVFDTRIPLDQQRWKAIVVHASGSPGGTAAQLDSQARNGGLKELGYHFVIGNGRGMDDGELFVGRRWRDQAPGAHVGGERGEWFNHHAIAICLIGDGDHHQPTKAQLDRVVELSTALARRLGIPRERIYLHSELSDTTSPGRLFPASNFREDVAARL